MSCLLTHPGAGWPCILAFELGPSLDLWEAHELGDFGVSHHFRLRLLEDTHGHRVSKHTPDLGVGQARLFSNLCKGDFATGRHHIQDAEPTDRVDTDEVGDLTKV